MLFKQMPELQQSRPVRRPVRQYIATPRENKSVLPWIFIRAEGSNTPPFRLNLTHNFSGICISSKTQKKTAENAEGAEGERENSGIVDFWRTHPVSLRKSAAQCAA
jgi:hypothetical protein